MVEWNSGMCPTGYKGHAVFHESTVLPVTFATLFTQAMEDLIGL